jgi:glycosyltransferase involved in cell wall biosynthesis
LSTADAVPVPGLRDDALPPSAVRFVVLRYDHHCLHSGYDQLAHEWIKVYPGEVIPVSKPLPRFIIRERLLWRLARDTPGYDRAAMRAELDVARKLLVDNGYLYHFLYGETTYHYAGAVPLRKQNRLVASFHLPPSGLRAAVKSNWHIKRLDAVVCVGRSQLDAFSREYGVQRVFFVPHGVDSAYFTPPASPDGRDPNLCLFVGENYRDFPTLRGVVELVSYRRPNTRFEIVASSRASQVLGSHPNMTVRSRLSDTDLLGLYRSASVGVLPLHDTTANNAILEGMACGLPTVVSDVGSIRDYMTPDCGVLVPAGAARRMADAVLDLFEAPAERQRMGTCARRQALTFDWPVVLRELRRVYTAVA